MTSAQFNKDVALWVWALPVVLFLVSAPLWLHWWEPQMFVAINTLCMPVAAQFWTGLSLPISALGRMASPSIWVPSKISG